MASMCDPIIPPALVLGCNTPHGIGVLSDWIEERTGHAPDFTTMNYPSTILDDRTIDTGRGYFYGIGHADGHGDGDDYGDGNGDGRGDGDAYPYFYGDNDGGGQGCGTELEEPENANDEYDDDFDDDGSRSETCWHCRGEGGFHDCGEDCCPCADPELNEICGECDGTGRI